MTSRAERIEKLLKGEGLCRKWLHQESRWCHQKQTEVRSIGGELIGMICRVGHVQGLGSHRRVKKCRGCGSRIADRHALGCGLADDLISTAIFRATNHSEYAVFDPQDPMNDPDDPDTHWACVQEELEAIFPFGDSRVGGRL